MIFFFISFFLFPFFSIWRHSSLGHSNFGHSNINLYNNYASASYATYTAPQYTTANPNRCPPNANIKPTSGGAGGSSTSSGGDRQDTRSGSNKSHRFGHHVLRKSKFDNGSGSDAVVANRHDRSFNESVIEEGRNNNFVSTKQKTGYRAMHIQNYHWLLDFIEFYGVQVCFILFLFY